MKWAEGWPTASSWMFRRKIGTYQTLVLRRLKDSPLLNANTFEVSLAEHLIILLGPPSP
jgi:hypothetical protein